MTDKEFRRLSRADLVDIIYQLQQEKEALEKENSRLKEQLEDRRVKMENAGSLAEVAAAVNDILNTAQSTADWYLDQIRQMRDEMNGEEPTAEETQGDR